MSQVAILARRIINTAETADNCAMATDGPVPPTHDCMTQSQLIQFFRDAYDLAKLTVGEAPPRR